MFHDYGDILNVEELMDILQIGRNSAYILLNSGQIKSFKVGRKHRIPRGNVIDYIIQKCKQ
ncbi:helix-turn-helix domain-containing protein [Paenibacillus sp. GP183]|uniref:helix-turn-helix domain-containing protein n=1 Tax=Paenibacillus sp. GP183 TaxID=1882751 RepID=UPI00089B4024|nr:helix-turn-helix domain-containing protein [Paenibacillus sp. GP183]SED14238.1 DNA binding domain-containing protein, excisionase family [Paenibacillus sp. GP183]